MHAPGLWSWTVDEMRCLYHEMPDGIVLADPLVPDAEAERFWRALDRDVERIGRPPTIVVSAPSLLRTAAVVRSRYPGAAILAPDGAAEGIRDAPLEDAAVLPGDVAALVHCGAALLRCPCHGLLWTGDLLHGGATGGLIAGPALSALGPAERHALAARLGGEPIDIAIPAVGAPVTDDAMAIITDALA